MRKEIKHTICYRDAGEDKSIVLTIDFISNRVMKDYSKLTTIAEQAKNANDRMSDLNTLITQVELKQEKDFEIKRDEYIEELDDCIKVIMEFENNGYFEKRFDLLKRILIDNKQGGNELLLSPEFWDENVDPTELINFLSVAVYKDVDIKKKV